MSERLKQLSMYAGAMFFFASVCSVMEIVFSIREIKIFNERISTGGGIAEGLIVAGVAVLLIQTVTFLMMAFSLMRGMTAVYGVSSIITGLGFLASYGIITYSHWYSSGGLWREMYIEQFNFGFIYIAMILFAVSFIVSGVSALAKKNPVIAVIPAVLYLAAIVMFAMFVMKGDARNPIRFFHIFSLIPLWMEYVEVAVSFAGLILTAMSFRKESEQADE